MGIALIIVNENNSYFYRGRNLLVNKVKAVSEAVKMIRNGSTVAIGGFIGTGHPEEITSQIEKSYLNQGFPKDLTIVYAAGQGDSKEKGLNHLGHEGLVSKVIGGHWGLAPKLQKLALDNKVQAYNLPQGVISHLFRDIAAKKVGTITHVGLQTFVDPRVEGGKLNNITKEDIIKVINIEGKERLLYKAFPIDVSIIRATYADEKGNLSFEKEATTLESISIAQAAKNSGGIVIAQVESVVKYGSLDPKLVKIPGIYVDAVVIAQSENHMQTFSEQFNPAYCGMIKTILDTNKNMNLDERKIISRRAAMELIPNSIVNLGIGVPEGVASVANEEGIADFYDGGGLDIAFLGLAQCDKNGNVNVSKFGPKIAGCGGFINITQNAKKVIYCGTFTAGGLKVSVTDDNLLIEQEGRTIKFIDEVEQITFSGEYAKEIEQQVLYITERAVFELSKKGLTLIEIAPGIDLNKDILNEMQFKPIISENLKIMDKRIFREEVMGINVG